MKSLLILTILLTWVNSVVATNCEDHPIFCSIVSNLPTIDKNYAMKLSNIIYKVSEKYKIPSLIYTAILMQESEYNQHAKGCIVGLDENLEEKRVCSDYGISQINYRTARRYKFDLKKILEDLEYAVDCGAIVLYNFKKRYEGEHNYWSRYNSSNKDKRQVYEKLVSRYIN